jgi:2-dehydropantoate 2-reductase
MQFTVIGAGAIGGTVGAHLVRGGHDVLFCDADAAHVTAMNASGLHVSGPVNDFVVPAPAVTPADLPETLHGVVVVAVKSQHTSIAVESLRGRLAPDAVVVSLQNGLTSDAIGPVVGYERLLVCFVNFGADYLGPGEVIQGNVGTFRIGELDGRMTDRLREIADALPYAEETDSIMGYLWAKEAYGAMLWAGAVSDLSIADSLEDPRYQPLMLAIAREVLAQAPVAPMGFDGFEPDDLPGSLARLVTFNRGSAKSHSGIYRDLMVRRRPTEVGELDLLAGPLTSYTAALIRAIERGDRTCEVANLDLLAALERLERLGRPVHAVVAAIPAPDRAADGPLHGVPVAVKDLMDIAGLPRGNGNPEDMAGPASEADAPVVSRLRQAGADVFALSSLLEYAAGAPHPDLPEARYPGRPDRTAGGSSGGSAALVAAGVCRVALGTDTGGSIRIPAAYCGVVGYKPTHGLVGEEGVTALSPSLDHVGLITAQVLVCLDVLPAIADSGADPGPVEPTAVRLGVLEDQLADPRLVPEIAAITRAALDRLATAGFVLEPRRGEVLAEAESLLEPILMVEAWQVHAATMGTRPEHFGEPTRRLFAAAEHADPAARESALARREDLRPAIAALCEGVDALVGPVVPYAAPELTPPIDTPEGEIEGIFTGPYNVTGQPAVTVPCGTTADGLPVGLQLAAPVGQDLALLRLAAAVETALGA